MNKVAVITGAGGWLGKSLSHFLANGHSDHEQLKNSEYNEVRCLVYGDEGADFLQKISPKIKVYSGDVTKIDTLKPLFEGDSETFDVYHTAGVIHPKNVKQFYDVNLEGTINLYESFPSQKVKKVVVVSSNSPIGCNPFPEHLFDEYSPYNPYMNYGKSKMKMEMAVTELSEKLELSTSLIRCPWFYGPNQPERQTLFFSMIKDGKMPIVGDGNNSRSMSYIDNLCQGIMLAGRHIEKGVSTFWISDEKPYTMNEIINTVKKVLSDDFGYKVSDRRLRLPWIVGEIATCVDWIIQKLGFYHQKFHVLSEMNKNISCSVEKAKRELGYQPVVSLEEGMRRSVRWCKENGQDF